MNVKIRVSRKKLICIIILIFIVIFEKISITRLNRGHYSVENSLVIFSFISALVFLCEITIWKRLTREL